MKEFKFWAMPFSLMPAFIAVIPFTIISLTMERFVYMWMVMVLFFILLLIFGIKRVRIIFSSSNDILIYYNKKEKYVGSKEKLEYVKGGNIRASSTNESLNFVFSDKKFSFVLFNTFGKTHIDLLRYMVVIYDLEKEVKNDTLIGLLKESYIYKNPQYNASLSANNDYNKKER